VCYAALDGSTFDLTEDFAEAEATSLPEGFIDDICEVRKRELKPLRLLPYDPKACSSAICDTSPKENNLIR
jgi:hypothetical protein